MMRDRMGRGGFDFGFDDRFPGERPGADFRGSVLDANTKTLMVAALALTVTDIDHEDIAHATTDIIRDMSVTPNLITKETAEALLSAKLG